MASLFTDKAVSELLIEHASMIDSLKGQATELGANLSIEPYCNDVMFLRYCLESDPEKGPTIQDTVEWRQGKGKAITDAARLAVSKATTGDKWDNEPIIAAAPHSSIISGFVTAPKCMSTTSSRGDVLYCLRAGKISDDALMDALGDDAVDKLAEFFVYAKEVNFIVVNRRSVTSDRLTAHVTCNDLSGTPMMGGDSRFRAALSKSSHMAAKMYPTKFSGPLLLLNPPGIVSVMAKLFQPLFPASMQNKIRFENGPLRDVQDLKEINYGGDGREQFLKEIDELLYKEE